MARNPNDQDWRDYHHPAMTYQAPKQLRRFRASMVLVVSTLLVGGLWTGMWFGAAQYVQKQVAHWVKEQALQGATAAYDSMEVSGFPSRIVLTLAKPRYNGPLDGQAIAWTGESLTLNTRPWMPWRLHAEAPGRHALTSADGTLNVSGKVARLSADLVAGAVWPKQLSFDVAGLDLDGTAVVRMDALQGALVHDANVKASGDGLALSLVGSNMTLPLGGGLGLGDTIESLDMALRVVGPVRPGALQGSLGAWRDVGGAVQVERVKLRIGPLAVAAVGTVTLDESFQPIGAFTAKFEGLFQVLRILRSHGVVRDSDAVVATMALAALSKRPPNGGPSAINLAVGLQDGKVSLGPVPVLAMPVIDWGFAPTPEQAVEAPQAPPRDYKDVPAIY